MSHKPANHLPRIRDPVLTRRLMAGVRLGEGGCWIWSGYCDRKGYGQVWYSRRAHWAHRLSFAVFEGDIPRRMTVHHRCCCPSCINPDHLELATRSWNSREARLRRVP